MHYRKIGKWGLKVSELACGTWITHVTDPEKKSIDREIIQCAYDSGINFFDCADVYAGGEAEKFLGECLQDYTRSSLVVSSKVYFSMGKGPNDGGLSRKHIFEQVERSLKNLKTDYLDLYFCHRYDPDTPVEETMQALHDLVTQGKILYYGVSEWLPSQIMDAVSVIRENHLRPLSVIQPQYHMFDRFLEGDMMQVCRQNGIGIVCFSPLAQGLLTGKYRKGMPIPENSRANSGEGWQVKGLMTEENLEKVEKLLQVSSELNMSLSNLALAWSLSKSEISSLIIGASKVSQLEENIKACDAVLSSDVLREIERILDNKPIPRKIG